MLLQAAVAPPLAQLDQDTLRYALEQVRGSHTIQDPNKTRHKITRMHTCSTHCNTTPGEAQRRRRLRDGGGIRLVLDPQPYLYNPTPTPNGSEMEAVYA